MKREGYNDVDRILLDSLTDIMNMRHEYFTNERSPDMQVEALQRIQFLQDELNRMLAIIGTIQSEQANTWYQCQNCGQRTFGKVESCDFCGESKFLPISV